MLSWKKQGRNLISPGFPFESLGFFCFEAKMGKLILVLGGARSGKSRFAIEYIKNLKSVLCIATYKQANDKEMDERIKRHRENRPKEWKVLEEPIELEKIIKKYAKRFKIILIDCVTLWISNLLLGKKTLEEILEEARNLIETIEKAKSKFILVSNEVGLGIVPDTKLGRRFRDIAGTVNQIIAGNADEVYFMIAGIPIKVK